MKRFPSIRRRCLFGVLLGILFVPAVFSAAGAEAPMARVQAPGFYRMMLGQIEVTALFDGSVDLDPKLMLNTTVAEIREQLTHMFVDTPMMPTPVNAYLIHNGSSLVLVDTGGGAMLGPNAGKLPLALKASGYEPDQVDAILITHLHGDHEAGLVDVEGKPAFSRAVVYVAKAESDYWLSASEAEKAPKEAGRFFEAARKVSAPYIASGRWKTFTDGELPFPGVKAVPIAGHTPGHTAYEVKSGADSLLIIGDMVHNMALQFANPTMAITFDTDPVRAVSTRQALFKSAAESRVLVAGMHIPFPGIGHIRADGEGTYTWVPVEYAPVK